MFGTVYTFGYGKHGQLGHPSDEKQSLSSPKNVVSLDTYSISSVVCGGAFTIALSEDGEVFSWGDQRGTKPKKIAAFRRLKIHKVSCGAMHSVALLVNSYLKSTLYYWGTSIVNSYPNLKNLPQQCITEPKIIPLSDIRITDIACGALHTLLLSDQGKVYSFGMNTKSQLGLPEVDEIPTEIPIEIPFTFGGYPVTKIACGGSHSIAINGKGKVYVWGENKYGQLGLGDIETRPIPTLLDLKQPVESATCGDYHTILKMVDGSVYVFGSNKNGQLGVGEVGVNQLIPRLLSFPDGAKKVTHIAAGGGFSCSHTLALTEHGNLFSWGCGSSGQLGHGDNLDYHTPKLLEYFQGKTVKSVSCGYLHTCVVVLENYVPPVLQIGTTRIRSSEPGLGSFDLCPNDVLILILSNLKCHDLVMLGSCSSFLDSYTRDNRLWQCLYLMDLCSSQTEEEALRSVHLLSLQMDWKDIYKVLYIEMFDRTKPILCTPKEKVQTLPPAQTSWMGTVTEYISSFTLRKPDFRILFVGLDAAGKTTVIYKLNLGEVITTIPTIGFNVETVTYKHISFVLWDVGGPDKIRPLWRHYYQNTTALIFIIDSADRDRICEASRELQNMLSEESLMDIPVLIFANKQDLPYAMTPYNLAVELGLRDSRLSKSVDCYRRGGADHPKLNGLLRDRLWCIQPSIAITGEGLFEGLDWLSSVANKPH